MKWPNRRWFLRAGIVAVLVAAGVSGFLWYRNANRPTQPKITISKETTFLTEPLNADGLPDYFAFLDERSREGVTPENNAAIPFWQAFGPKTIPEPLREEFFKRLGMKPLPEEGEYFIPLEDFVDSLGERGFQMSSDEFYDQFIDVDEIPWKAEDYPAIAAWFKVNEKPANLILDASHRPRFYAPCLRTKRHPIADFDEAFSFDTARESYCFLGLRAFLRIGEGDLAAAQEDLLTCHRLARLYAQYQSSSAIQVSIAGDAVASNGEEALLNTGKLTSEELLSYHERLKSLGPPPGFEESYNYYERFNLIDSVLSIAKHDSDEIQGFSTGFWSYRATEELKTLWKRHQRRIRTELVDWNAILRTVNSTVDVQVEALQTNDLQKRREIMERMKESGDSLKAQRERLNDQKELAQYAEDGWTSDADKKGATDWFARLYVNDLAGLSGVPILDGRARLRYDLVLLAFGISAYQADNGEYPDRLEQLIPKYAALIPDDFFSGKPVKYERTVDGFIVYSIGENQQDEGGLGYEPGTPEDDFAIQIPLPKPKNSAD